MRIVSGRLKGRTIVMPDGDRTRPTTEATREALFSIITQHISMEQANVLDLCCGSGSLGFEALSRGARHATFIDNGKLVCSAVKQSVANLGLEKQTTIYCADALSAITSLPRTPDWQPYDCIFADPPYERKMCNQLAIRIDSAGLVNSNGLLVLEHGVQESILPISGWELITSREKGVAIVNVRKFVGNQSL